MIIDVYRIDGNGIYVDTYKVNGERYYNGTEWIDIDFKFVKVAPPNCKVAKWEESKWVVIEEYQEESTSEVEPTLQERNRADIDYLSVMTGVDL